MHKHASIAHGSVCCCCVVLFSVSFLISPFFFLIASLLPLSLLAGACGLCLCPHSGMVLFPGAPLSRRVRPGWCLCACVVLECKAALLDYLSFLMLVYSLTKHSVFPVPVLHMCLPPCSAVQCLVKICTKNNYAVCCKGCFKGLESLTWLSCCIALH